eukprot:1214598-Karenia_brevis.AAC.1
MAMEQVDEQIQLRTAESQKLRTIGFTAHYVTQPCVRVCGPVPHMEYPPYRFVVPSTTVRGHPSVVDHGFVPRVVQG